MMLMDTRAKVTPAAWVEPLARWCQAMAAAGASRATIRLRRAHVAQLARALRVPPAEVTAVQLLEWLAGREWRRETRRAWRASLRAWWEAVGRPDLAAVIPRARPEIPTPRPAPDEVLELALLAADERTTMILRLAAEAGLRRGEISQLHARDVMRDLLGWSLLVHGKGDKLRIVPISDELAFSVRRRCDGSWLLPGNLDGHLSPARVGELASEVLPGDWTLHTLRHRFATRAHDRTQDIVAVSRLLGHASVATTQRYVASDAARLRMVAAAAA